MDQRLKVCQVVASITPVSGGPAESVTGLADTLFDLGVDSHLFTLDYPGQGAPRLPGKASVHTLSAPFATRLLRGFHPKAARALTELACNMQLLHNHGLWMAPNLYARNAARRAAIPLVISPRGMLENWSLKNRAAKKRLAWILYEHGNLKNAAAFHATSHQEAHSLRELRFRQPVAMIPNGVNLPEIQPSQPRSALEQKHGELKRKRWLLFLSRVHPKKGVDILLRAWAGCCTDYPNWHLVIAGPGPSDYVNKMTATAHDLGIANRLTLTGLLTGDLKTAALCNSELFVLPSYSENFGNAVAEALAFEVPVITTTATPWSALVEVGAGWWIVPEEDTLKRCLREALSLSESRLREMGTCGRVLISESYCWPKLGKEYLAFYRWLLLGDNRPECVYLD